MTDTNFDQPRHRPEIPAVDALALPNLTPEEQKVFGDLEARVCIKTRTARVPLIGGNVDETAALLSEFAGTEVNTTRIATVAHDMLRFLSMYAIMDRFGSDREGRDQYRERLQAEAIEEAKMRGEDGPKGPKERLLFAYQAYKDRNQFGLNKMNSFPLALQRLANSYKKIGAMDKYQRLLDIGTELGRRQQGNGEKTYDEIYAEKDYAAKLGVVQNCEDALADALAEIFGGKVEFEGMQITYFIVWQIILYSQFLQNIPPVQ